MDAADRERVLAQIRGVVGDRHAFADPYEMRLYQYDASPETALPDIVVIPGTAKEVAQVVKICADGGVPITARSGASSLAGGTVPVEGGVVITFARMDRILEIDIDNLRAVVQPGVVNLSLSQALKPHGYYYVPDPSSQGACTIGGNVATNAGGPHTLLYGVTVNHVTGLEVALTSGELVQVGGRNAAEAVGYDLTGVLVGSEGTMGVVTRIWVKIQPLPPVQKTLMAVYPDVATASNAVSATRSTPARSCCSKSMARQRLPRNSACAWRKSAARTVRPRCGSLAMRPNARRSGKAARERSRPWVAFRPTST